MNPQVTDSIMFSCIWYGDSSSDLWVEWNGRDELVELDIDFWFYPVIGHA